MRGLFDIFPERVRSGNDPGGWTQWITNNRVATTLRRWRPLTRRWFLGLYRTQTVWQSNTGGLPMFDSVSEHEGYTAELDRGETAELRNRALEAYERAWGHRPATDVYRDYYALTRKLQPEVLVETGVCNGISTLYFLLALAENQRGVLHSIDYPYFADESLKEFRAETFAKYGGAAIPADETPGWIVPDELHDQWTLWTGKSQRRFPELVAEIGEFDIFLHDSEHSVPCMMFEYELAWEHLTDGGILLSDDVDWNEAFETFFDIRKPARKGLITDGVGYARK